MTSMKFTDKILYPFYNTSRVTQPLELAYSEKMLQLQLYHIAVKPIKNSAKIKFSNSIHLLKHSYCIHSHHVTEK